MKRQDLWTTPYKPKGNTPAAFIAKGGKSANSLLQTNHSQLVVAQLSDSTLNEVMLQRGLGETGESIWLAQTSSYAPAPEIPTAPYHLLQRRRRSQWS